MKIFKVFGAIIGIIILAVVILYFTGPNEVNFERSTQINAAPAAVYKELNSFETFNEWSPWYQRDTAAEYTIDGPAYGPGAHFSWVSENPNVGSGSMTIRESKENEMILYQMDFGMMGKPYSRYLIEEVKGGVTKLTWTYEDDGAVTRMMSAFMDLEEMVGPDYEQGLENFKQYMESRPARDTDLAISVTDAEPITYLGISETILNATNESISNTMSAHYQKLSDYMQENEIEAAGMPLTVYTSMSEDSLGLISGIPINNDIDVSDADISKMTIEGGKVVKAVHKGDYTRLPDTYRAVDQFISQNNLQKAGNPYEIYITDPGEVKDTTAWVTHVFYPVNK
ncbi:MAG: SRPBCC family protein [Fulvivirga sp.]|nr:SRPBCC family protein [Fulvivirga sp.]